MQLRGVLLRSTVALEVTNDVGPGLLPNRQRRWAPQLATLLVPDVDRLARGVAHRIVRPRGELVFAAVDRPCVPRTRFGDLEAEARIRDHIHPGGRRALSLAKERHVFPSLRREPAEAVEELEIRRRERHVRRRLPRCLPPFPKN